MDWLLTNESDPTIDDQLPGEFFSDSDDEDEDASDVDDGAVNKDVYKDDGKAGETSANSVDAPVSMTTNGVLEGEGAVGGSERPKFKSILETIRNHQQKEFRPNRRVCRDANFP